jgi:hypothetical protein
VALVSGIAAAGVGYYKFASAEKELALANAAKAEAETKTFSIEAQVNTVASEYIANPASHPKLDAEIAKLDANPTYSPPHGILTPLEDLAFARIATLQATQRIERQRLAAEARKAEAEEAAARAAAAKSVQETRSVVVGAEVQEKAVRPAIPALIKGLKGATTGDGNVLGVPPGSIILPHVPGASETPRPDPYKSNVLK